MRKELRAVENDLFDIAARVKSVDENFKIYFNGETRRYEIHDPNGFPTLRNALPFEQLDCRALLRAWETRPRNAARLLREIERGNRALEREQTARARRAAENRTEETLRRLLR